MKYLNYVFCHVEAGLELELGNLLFNKINYERLLHKIDDILDIKDEVLMRLVNVQITLKPSR